MSLWHILSVTIASCVVLVQTTALATLFQKATASMKSMQTLVLIAVHVLKFAPSALHRKAD